MTGMKFGRFGREDGALVMTTKGNENYILTVYPKDVFDQFSGHV